MVIQILKKIDKNTLVIFTYLSTGFFELLSLNCKCLTIFDLNKNFYILSFIIRLKN